MSETWDTGARDTRARGAGPPSTGLLLREGFTVPDTGLAVPPAELWTPDRERCLQAARFFPRHLSHPKGRWRGTPLELVDWELEFLYEVLRTRPDGLRRYRDALLGIGRKAGKTTFIAGLGLYLLLLDDEPGAEVYSAAGDKEQARILFNIGKFMIESSPELSDLVRVYKDVIEVPETGSFWKVLSSEAYTKEGMNPSHVLFDELHVQANREFYDVLTLGSGAREQPLTLALTTAGRDLETICGELYLHGEKVRTGQERDDAFLFRWYGVPRQDGEYIETDYHDLEVWRRHHPGVRLGVVSEEYVEGLVKKKPENIVRRYVLNEWVRAETAWLPQGAWTRCRTEAVAGYELEEDRLTFTGTDASTHHDSTGHVLAQWTDEGRLRVSVRHPATLRLPRAEAQLARLVRRGADEKAVDEARLLVDRLRRAAGTRTCWERPGDAPDEWRIPVAEVENALRDAHAVFDSYKMNYDPNLFSRSGEALSDEGLNMVEFPQSAERMVPACQALYDLVVDGVLEHDGDPVLARHLQAAVMRETDRGWRLVKTKASEHIDLAVALAMCVHAALERRPSDEGLRVLGDDDYDWEDDKDEEDTPDPDDEDDDEYIPLREL